MAMGELRWFRSVALSVATEGAFFGGWKANKGEFARRGWEVRKNGSQWIVQQWLAGSPDAYELTPYGAERLAAATGPMRPQRTKVAPAPVGELPAALAAALRGYQVEPAKQLLRSLKNGNAEWGYPGALDLSDMGTGKTYMSLAAALATGRKIGVICPPVGMGGWERAFQHFGAEAHFLSTYEAVRGSWRPHIAGFQADGKFRWQQANDILLILDEAQALRHDDSLTSQTFSAAVNQGIPIIMASATIAVSPLEFRYAGRISGLHAGGRDWERFLADHGCFKKGATYQWGKNIADLRKIHDELFPWRGCRVRKESLGEECPETEISLLAVIVEEQESIAEQWSECEETARRLMTSGRGDQAMIAIRQARMKIWQRCEMALVEPMARLARKEMDAGRSVAVFMSFNESRIKMMKLLNTNAGFFGGQPLKKRQYWEREFQANRQPCLVSNIGAGGASVSLHDLTGDRPRTSIIFPNDNPVKMVQATGRVDRVGGQTLSRQFIPYVAGTLMEKMVLTIRRKMKAINTLNDGMAVSKI